MTDESPEPITDAQCSQIREVLFRLLRSNGVEVDDSTELFRHEFVSQGSGVTIDFQIGREFFAWALRASKAIDDRTFRSAVDTLLREGKIRQRTDRDEQPTDMPAAEFSNTDAELAGLFAYLIMKGMPGKLRSAFFELGLETEKIYEAFLMKGLKDTDIVKETGYEPPNMNEQVKALSKRMASERKQFLTAQIDRFSTKPRFDRMPELYPTLLKVWQSARRIYEDNGETDTWRAMVKVKYPELQFDDDLLIRITGRLQDLPENVQALLSEKDGDHTPNTIALEHAARMCGATPYQFGTRYYHNLKTPKMSKTEQTEID